jgi:nicotinamidase-related amidase
MNTRALKILVGSQKTKRPLISSLATLLLLTLCVDVASAQTTLINGANRTGTIYTNTVADSYTFTANTGDSINVRLGTTGFNGELQLFAPNSALLATDQAGTDNLITNTAIASGTYTVLVSSSTALGTGTYVLNLAQIPESFIVPSGDQGGPMINGGAYPGTITLGDQEMWSFTANAGDNVSVRLGSAFEGRLQLYGPNGALLATTQNGGTDNLLTDTATNSGIYTVLVSSEYLTGYGGYTGGTGTYVLSVAEAPESFIVSPGYQGGPMINGGAYPGTITLGDQEMWSFTANAGDNVSVRLGSAFEGRLQLYGPNGALLATTQNGGTDNLLTDTATNSGIYTVLVSSEYLTGYGGYTGGTGTYVLSVAQFPEPFIVPSGDPGGAMSGSASYDGAITLGAQDMFSFTACTGDSIDLGLKTTNFNGNLELYGANGLLLKTTQGNNPLSIAYTATNCGNFTVLVSSEYLTGYGGYTGGTGTYGLTANGLEDSMRVCFPVISGASLTVNGVGGPTNAGFVLYSATNVATPFGLWTPVLTNQFNQFGVFGYTNIYNSAQRQQFYRFLLQ